ncbi:c-type cytochrome [Neptunomonas sp.]|uniref:c-type cytochrome n=1 Tax=Neptunomonas sp. TaxID=1971898 RepID=UPI00356ADDC8
MAIEQSKATSAMNTKSAEQQLTVNRPPADKLLYGVVVRPPNFYMQDIGFTCSSLVSLDKSAALLLKGVVSVVVQGDFVGIVANDLETARRGAKLLKINWSELPAPTKAQRTGNVLQSTTNGIKEIDGKDTTHREYFWPNRLRWGNRPDWAIASKEDGRWRVWAGSQTPDLLQADLARMLNCDSEIIELIGASTRNAVGRDCVDDAAADAVLLAHLVGQSVAIWLSSDYQQVVTNLGKAQKISVVADWHHARGVEKLDYHLHQVWSCAPVMALLLAGGTIPTTSSAYRTTSPYVFNQQKIVEPNSYKGPHQVAKQADIQDAFARESFIDELAYTMQRDPVELRREYIDDERGLELIDQVVKQAQWSSDEHHGLVPSKHQDLLCGRGFAYDHSQLSEDTEKNDKEINDTQDVGLQHGTRSAWVADIEVNRITGEVQLNRIVVGQDSGVEIDQEVLREELQQELLGQNTSLFLGEDRFDQWPNTSGIGEISRVDLVSAPTLTGSDLRSQEHRVPATRVDSEVLNPAVAVIANALYDATGIRFREPPFTPERIRDQFALAGDTSPKSKRPSNRWRNVVSLAAASTLGVLAIAWPWKGAIAPIIRPAADLYSVATIERGRLIAEAGDCAVCHTAMNGEQNIGGRPFETPFGKLYSSNITPDEKTGIGSWSFEAFDRAMRHGISRDGRNLYPAFPYTAFAKINESDMQALYAYLMAQPAVSMETPEPELSFPFNYRPLMAGWNALFHDAKPFQPNPLRSTQWNRGAYLAEGLGHCSACHTPRNKFGAEKIGASYFAGAMVDGWEALPLNELSKSPVPWTEDALFSYLRNGVSDQHGVAAGPMAAVVAGLSELPEVDVKAIAHYVASFTNDTSVSEAVIQERAEDLKQQTQATPRNMDQGRRVFESACAVCHVKTDLPSFTDAQTSLALNTNLHSDHPDNLIQTILYGVQAVGLELPGVNVMPAFNTSLSDENIASLVDYLRAKYSPNSSQWQSVTEKVAHYRANKGSH